MNQLTYYFCIPKRDNSLRIYVGTNCPHVDLEGKGGKNRKNLVTNTEGAFRIIIYSFAES